VVTAIAAVVGSTAFQRRENQEQNLQTAELYGREIISRVRLEADGRLDASVKEQLAVVRARLATALGDVERTLDAAIVAGTREQDITPAIDIQQDRDDLRRLWSEVSTAEA
jgi:hypothetical protein